MALIRYNPWQEMNSIQRQLNRLFDDALTSNEGDDFGNFSRIPAAELTEADNALHLNIVTEFFVTQQLEEYLTMRRAVLRRKISSNDYVFVSVSNNSKGKQLS